MKNANDKAEGKDAEENIAGEAKAKDDNNVNVSSCTNETDSCATPSTSGKFLRFIAYSELDVFDNLFEIGFHLFQELVVWLTV